MKDQITRPSNAPSLAEPLTLKFLAVLREGYDLRCLKSDTIAGLAGCRAAAAAIREAA